jgi:hypothetical protein
MARLVILRIERGPDADIGPTREFEEREAPYIALRDRALRRRFVVEGLALTAALRRLQAMRPSATVTFTGWDMSHAEMVTHGRSELALHRWDLIGSDEVSEQLLSDTALLAHGRAVHDRMHGFTPVDSNGESTAMRSLLEMWGRDPDWHP